jgi:hypothetical protein
MISLNNIHTHLIIILENSSSLLLCLLFSFGEPSYSSFLIIAILVDYHLSSIAVCSSTWHYIQPTRLSSSCVTHSEHSLLFPYCQQPVLPFLLNTPPTISFHHKGLPCVSFFLLFDYSLCCISISTPCSLPSGDYSSLSCIFLLHLSDLLLT